MEEPQKIRTTVEILGTQYVIIGKESTEHIQLVATMVDEKMREIKSKNPSLDASKLAVLTAINAVNEYIKIKKELEMLEKKE